MQQRHQHHTLQEQPGAGLPVFLVLCRVFVCTPFHQGELGQRAGAGEHWGMFAQCTVAAATREI